MIHRFRRGKPEDIGIPLFLFKFISYRLLKQASGQGYGLHTMDEGKHLNTKSKLGETGFIIKFVSLPNWN